MEGEIAPLLLCESNWVPTAGPDEDPCSSSFRRRRELFTFIFFLCLNASVFLYDASPLLRYNAISSKPGFPVQQVYIKTSLIFLGLNTFSSLTRVVLFCRVSRLPFVEA